MRRKEHTGEVELLQNDHGGFDGKLHMTEVWDLLAFNVLPFSQN